MSFLFYFFRFIFRLVGNVDVVVDKLRVDGSRVRLAEVEVGDEVSSYFFEIEKKTHIIITHTKQTSKLIVFHFSSVLTKTNKDWMHVSPSP